jgi:UDP-2-acetamido-3-amino-2,3-dideoxy-glucuronate N-acetyltransferase
VRRSLKSKRTCLVRLGPNSEMWLCEALIRTVQDGAIRYLRVVVLFEPSADVSPTAEVGAGCKIWHLAQVREAAVLGENVIVGRGAYIGSGVRVGRNSKIQNFALIYEPASLGDGVFVGPAAILTNDHRPRAIRPDGVQKTGSDWDAVGVTVLEGASVGARAVCVAPLVVGRWAMIAAGAVVIRDVPDFALVAGVPARQLGWVGRTGCQLIRDPVDAELFRCPDTGAAYVETYPGSLVEVVE